MSGYIDAVRRRFPKARCVGGGRCPRTGRNRVYEVIEGNKSLGAGLTERDAWRNAWSNCV